MKHHQLMNRKYKEGILQDQKSKRERLQMIVGCGEHAPRIKKPCFLKNNLRREIYK